jgi:hypothetical protein
MITGLMLRAIAFSMICGIIGYILFVLVVWFIAVIQIGVWVFDVISKGGVLIG